MSGWGEMGWTFVPKDERVCRRCGKALKMDDVGEDRTVHRTQQERLPLQGCVRARSEARQSEYVILRRSGASGSRCRTSSAGSATCARASTSTTASTAPRVGVTRPRTSSGCAGPAMTSEHGIRVGLVSEALLVVISGAVLYVLWRILQDIFDLIDYAQARADRSAEAEQPTRERGQSDSHSSHRHRSFGSTIGIERDRGPGSCNGHYWVGPFS